MFALDVFVAVLTSRHHAEVLTLHETLEAAIGQCRAWIATSPRCTEVMVTGYPLWIQYGTRQDTVRVQQCTLALADPADDAAPLTLDLDDAAPETDASWHPVTRMEWDTRVRAERVTAEEPCDA